MMGFFKAGVCGYAALGCAASLIIAGYFVMNKLSQIEV